MRTLIEIVNDKSMNVAGQNIDTFKGMPSTEERPCVYGTDEKAVAKWLQIGEYLHQRGGGYFKEVAYKMRNGNTQQDAEKEVVDFVVKESADLITWFVGRLKKVEGGKGSKVRYEAEVVSVPPQYEQYRSQMEKSLKDNYFVLTDNADTVNYIDMICQGPLMLFTFTPLTPYIAPSGVYFHWSDADDKSKGAKYALVHVHVLSCKESDSSEVDSKLTQVYNKAKYGDFITHAAVFTFSTANFAIPFHKGAEKQTEKDMKTMFASDLTEVLGDQFDLI